MLDRLRLRQHSDLVEDTSRDPDFFLELSNKGFGRHLVSLAVTTDEVPHTGIEDPIRRAPGEQDLAVANEEPSRTNPHPRALSCSAASLIAALRLASRRRR